MQQASQVPSLPLLSPMPHGYRWREEGAMEWRHAAESVRAGGGEGEGWKHPSHVRCSGSRQA